MIPTARRTGSPLAIYGTAEWESNKTRRVSDNPVTLIRYTIGSAGDGRANAPVLTRLHVFDLLGRQVATLVDEVKASGNYEARFDASQLASGVYFCRLNAGGFTDTRKMILTR